VSEPAAAAGGDNRLLIEIADLWKTYAMGGNEVHALRGVDLQVRQGEYLAIMGPSGSGKSTLLNLIAGLDKPTSGTVRVGGAEVSAMTPAQLAEWRSRNVGFVFQSFNLLPVLTAFQNVELPLLLTRLSKKEREERVRIALGVVGLDDRLHHYPRQLSGGQEQRVAIARAVVADPTLILLDEPTGQLDAKSSQEVLTLLGRLNAEFNKTIIVVTHDPQAAVRARRQLHLEKGTFVEQDQPAQPVAGAAS
jgi:putative ABC transport system ATP-binding protein